MLGLFVRKGLNKGAYFPLDPSRKKYVLGRDPGVQLVLADDGVSRRHAEIVLTNGGWVLRDLGSKNGTFLNGLPVRERQLIIRDMVVIGRAELMVVEKDPSSPPDERSWDENLTAPFILSPAQSIVGDSPKIREVIETIERVAPLNTTVLVRGETGTGKELVGRAIHSSSPRRDRPFVAVNCGALPESLVESELFGHEKGAFTGAAAARKGCFEEANGGSLFLDEIGDLPLPAQTNLLRVLQEKVIRRIGAQEEIRVDVRVIAATHRDLEDAVKEKSFREDLYHRLKIVEIHVPPLRDRTSDIAALADMFLGEITVDMGIAPVSLSNGALEVLKVYTWPGNVRELRNTLERAVIQSSSGEIQAEDIAVLHFSTDSGLEPGPPGAGLSILSPELLPGETLESRMAAVESAIIQRALENENWNQSAAARRLGISEGKIRKWMKLTGVQRPES